MVAVEEVFYSVNVKSALKLGQVRGVALLAAARLGLPVAEYAPLRIKSSVVGYGLAQKEQVQFMVARLLGLAERPEPADAADALAIAICHIHTAQTLVLQGVRDAEAGTLQAGKERGGEALFLALALAVRTTFAQGAESDSVVRVDFSNPGLTPSQWTLEFHPDGSGHFRSSRGEPLRPTIRGSWKCQISIATCS